jgi:hypothetical protein
LSGRDCEKNTCSPNGIQLPYTLTARKKYWILLIVFFFCSYFFLFPWLHCLSVK